ncbi:MAG: helix-turn-helix transcriptional regulator, partial [Lachnospiraceae bacterium]|nr:helix-turn-helix transcriptional regulator [Lachnospiraceae bacterium]
MRTMHGYTQQQLADYLGISRPSYTLYESGKREPTKISLLKLRGNPPSRPIRPIR